MNTELIQYLSQFLLENRFQTFENVLKSRTRYLTVVLEDLFQAQNASAVLRTCECFGVQDVYVIENRNKFIVHRDISMGSNKWLNIRKFKDQADNSLTAVNHLRDKGYRIVATSPDPVYPLIQDFDISKGKIALFFGTELSGISKTIKANADEFIRIPMYGFTESFNISVSAALCLQNLIERLHTSDVDWKLSKEEYSDLLLTWMRYSIKKVDLIEKKFHKLQNS
jgi:tRNA (guanosine-2'-O-)-methyltransferase